MNAKALRTLEFDKIVEMLAAKAISGPGKALARALVPAVELYDIQITQKETTEAMSYVLKNGSLPLGGIRDVGAAVKRAEIGGVLNQMNAEQIELLKILNPLQIEARYPAYK